LPLGRKRGRLTESGARRQATATGVDRRDMLALASGAPFPQGGAGASCLSLCRCPRLFVLSCGARSELRAVSGRVGAGARARLACGAIREERCMRFARSTDARRMHRSLSRSQSGVAAEASPTRAPTATLMSGADPFGWAWVRASKGLLATAAAASTHIHAQAHALNARARARRHVHIHPVAHMLTQGVRCIKSRSRKPPLRPTTTRRPLPSSPAPLAGFHHQWPHPPLLKSSG